MTYLFNPSNEIVAKAAAAALIALFPNLEIISASSTARGFKCFLQSPKGLHPDQIPFIEQKMREFFKNGEIQFFEMVRKSAIEFLNYHGRRKKAQELRSWSDGVIKLVKVGSFVDLCPDVLTYNDELKPSFKLNALISTESSQGKTTYLLEGFSSEDEKGLKEKVKTFKKERENFHLIKLKNQGLLKSAHDSCKLAWTAQGMAYLESFEKAFQPLLEGSEIILPLEPMQDEESLFFSLQRPLAIKSIFSTKTDAENDLGLYSIKENHGYCVFFKNEKREALFEQISLYLKKCLSLLSDEIFVHVRIPKGADRDFFSHLFYSSKLKFEIDDQLSISIYAKDMFDTFWLLFKMEFDKQKNNHIAKMIILSLERLVALTVEAHKGHL